MRGVGPRPAVTPVVADSGSRPACLVVQDSGIEASNISTFSVSVNYSVAGCLAVRGASVNRRSAPLIREVIPGSIVPSPTRSHASSLPARHQFRQSRRCSLVAGLVAIMALGLASIADFGRLPPK